MREIKFRVWDKLNKKMIYLIGFIYKETEIRIWYYDSEGLLVNESFNKENVILMQYTGLKDKNGVEIYEGDVLEQEINCMYHEGKNIREVRYADDQFLSGDCSLHGAIKSFDAVVIGNIHENPELVEVN